MRMRLTAWGDIGAAIGRAVRARRLSGYRYDRNSPQNCKSDILSTTHHIEPILRHGIASPPAFRCGRRDPAFWSCRSPARHGSATVEPVHHAPRGIARYQVTRAYSAWSLAD